MTETEEQIRQFLAILDAAARGNRRRPSATGIDSPAGLVLRYGCPMTGRSKVVVATGKRKECFLNAQILAMDHPEFVYCEGWATPMAFAFPTLHAWCVTRRGAHIVDPTWTLERYPEGAAYYGVKIRTSYMTKAVLATMTHHPVIDEWERGYPLLEDPKALKKAIIPCRK